LYNLISCKIRTY